MYKLRQLTLALALITLGITGCKKDDVQNSDSKPDVKASLKTTQQLLSFREQMNLKSSSSLPADSATWYLEGLLNFENANNDHKIFGLTFNHDSLVLNTAGSNISMAELNIAYNYFSDKLNQISLAYNDTAYKFDLIDININYSGLKSGETIITMVAPSGYHLIGNYIAFEDYDYWFWGGNLGKCGNFTGNEGIDAADKLQLRFNNPINPYEPGYFTSVEEKEAWPIETVYADPNYPGSWNPTMIFYASGTGSSPPSEPCLSPLELNYYLSKFDFIKNYNKPPGKAFKNVEVKTTVGTQMSNWERLHYYVLYYGFFNQYN